MILQSRYASLHTTAFVYPSDLSELLHSERGLTKDLIRKKHRQLMLLNHPDRGGSPYLATKINEAKDFLEKSN